MSLTATGIVRPSNSSTSMTHPVRAFRRDNDAVCNKLLPWRRKRGWGFSCRTNARSAEQLKLFRVKRIQRMIPDHTPGEILIPSSPSQGNVICVPDLQPGPTTTLKTLLSARSVSPSDWKRWCSGMRRQQLTSRVPTIQFKPVDRTWSVSCTHGKGPQVCSTNCSTRTCVKSWWAQVPRLQILLYSFLTTTGSDFRRAFVSTLSKIDFTSASKGLEVPKKDENVSSGFLDGCHVSPARKTLCN